MNVPRIKRYIARTTPDVVRFEFDPADENSSWRIAEWSRDFTSKMMIKHKGDVAGVDLEIQDSFDFYHKIITARVRRHRIVKDFTLHSISLDKEVGPGGGRILSVEGVRASEGFRL